MFVCLFLRQYLLSCKDFGRSDSSGTSHFRRRRLEQEKPLAKAHGGGAGKHHVGGVGTGLFSQDGPVSGNARRRCPSPLPRREPGSWGAARGVKVEALWSPAALGLPSPEELQSLRFRFFSYGMSLSPVNHHSPRGPGRLTGSMFAACVPDEHFSLGL